MCDTCEAMAWAMLILPFLCFTDVDIYILKALYKWLNKNHLFDPGHVYVMPAPRQNNNYCNSIPVI